MPVFRFGVRAQPTANNPKYATWQPADFIAFIVDDRGSAAEKRFQAMTWEFSPKSPSSDVEKKRFNAFDQLVSEIMTEWGREGFIPNPNPQPLAEPVSFEYGGKTFVWDPGKAPFSSSEIAGAMGADPSCPSLRGVIVDLILRARD